jgi:hypothetical protein
MTLADARSEFLRNGARELLQQAVEAEVAVSCGYRQSLIKKMGCEQDRDHPQPFLFFNRNVKQKLGATIG